MIAADSDAYWLWDRTRSAVTSAAYPRRIVYTIAISGFDGQTAVTEHYHASCDPNDGTVRIFPISDEAAKSPPTPHGFNMLLGLRKPRRLGGIFSFALGHPPPYQDLLGVPDLAPTYMFGIRYPPAPRTTSPPDNDSLRVIATVTSRNDYSVSLVDLSPIEGMLTYHLRLNPLRHPREDRLRELWIGAADYLPRKAVIAGDFTQAPFVDVEWTVNFSIIEGAPYVRSETAAAALALPHRRNVRGAVVAFTDIGEPSSIYDVPLFEPELNGSLLVEPRADAEPRY